MKAIDIDNLSFSYDQSTMVLSELCLSVPKGAIYGFLGSNGAGKSTAIRNIVGLLKPQKGKINILGVEIKNNLMSNQKIGSLIEAPSLYGHLTARDHLKIVCKYQDCGESNIEKVLEQVGLKEVRKKKTSQFSLGMKQRLGLAMALMHDPEILILDEPTVGLDPIGIKDMRKYIQDLCAVGKTIFLSSHHLVEVQKIATHIGILKSGKLIFEGTVQALDDLRKKDQSILIHCSQIQRAMKLLNAYIPQRKGETSFQLNSIQEENIPNVVRILVLASIDIYEIIKMRGNLESTFFELTENN